MKKPTEAIVFGALNIVFAVFSMVGVLVTISLFAITSGPTKNPVIQLIHDNAAYALWMKMTIPLGMVVSAALLAAGIGLLQLKPWARLLSMGYAIYGIAMVLVGTVVNYFCLMQPLMARAHGNSAPEAAAAGGALVSGAVGSCFGLLYPVLLLIFMLRPNVVAAFKAAGVQPTGASQL
jgi:hypothetical protein